MINFTNMASVGLFRCLKLSRCDLKTKKLKEVPSALQPAITGRFGGVDPKEGCEGE